MSVYKLIDDLSDQEVEAIALSILQGFSSIALNEEVSVVVNPSTFEDFLYLEIEGGKKISTINNSVYQFHEKLINKLRNFLQPIIDYKVKTGNLDLEEFSNSYKVRLVKILDDYYAEIQSSIYNAEEPVYLKV